MDYELNILVEQTCREHGVNLIEGMKISEM
jgi:hypothetical protein